MGKSDPPEGHIQSVRDVIEYFRDLVQEALRNQEVDASELTEFYIANLLSRYIRLDQTPLSTGESLGEEPIALQFLSALREELDERIRRLKELGDFSLFISGFYPESLQKRTTDLKYYIALGEKAYGNVAVLIRNHSFYVALYTDLSSRFSEYVAVLSEVSEKSQISSNRDAVRIYERWLKTRSHRDARLLQSLGIYPARPGRESFFVQ